jgi:hypothetical protein
MVGMEGARVQVFGPESERATVAAANKNPGCNICRVVTELGVGRRLKTLAGEVDVVLDGVFKGQVL